MAVTVSAGAEKEPVLVAAESATGFEVVLYDAGKNGTCLLLRKRVVRLPIRFCRHVSPQHPTDDVPTGLTHFDCRVPEREWRGVCPLSLHRKPAIQPVRFLFHPDGLH